MLIPIRIFIPPVFYFPRQPWELSRNKLIKYFFETP